MKNLYFLILLQCSFCSNNIFAQHAFGEINGFVRAMDTNEVLPFAKVIIEGNGETIQTQTDFDGYFAVNGLLPSFYQVTFHYVGYTSKLIKSVLVRADEQTPLNVLFFSLKCKAPQKSTVNIPNPLLKLTPIDTNKPVAEEQILSMPTSSIEDLIAKLCLSTVVITKYKDPLLKSDRIGTGKTFTKEEIQSMPIRNIEEIANLAANRF